MSNKQRVEKTTHLKAQLSKLNAELNFGVKNTREIAKFYNNRIQRYSLQ